MTGNGGEPRKHTISVLVENKFGVLSRVAGLFSARGYNIESLTVAPTEEIIRMNRAMSALPATTPSTAISTRPDRPSPRTNRASRCRAVSSISYPDSRCFLPLASPAS